MREIDWSALLQEEDAESLWNGLYHMVSRHPATRPLHFNTNGAAVSSQVEINADLVQELFLELFQKQRFEHYLDNQYSSTEIENELVHIEIPNLVGARLRKRYPESFRMARRVSSLLKSSRKFRRFGAGSAPKGRAASVADSVEFEEPAEDSPGVKRVRVASQMFGLSSWPESKQVGDSGLFQEFAKSVPIRKRDTRFVGRSGSSQLIVSNPELERLIIEVFEAIDSPADVRTIRQLVLSKLPLQDYNVASLDEEIIVKKSGSTLRREAADTRETPEGVLLRKERHDQAADLASEFLLSLRKAVNNNERRFTRLLSTLWYCYFDPEGPSQIEIAKMLGVSDSLVSDNRRLIEHELKKLRLSVDEANTFSESLQRLISRSGSVLAVTAC